jgi:hypothetical protein
MKAKANTGEPFRLRLVTPVGPIFTSGLASAATPIIFLPPSYNLNQQPFSPVLPVSNLLLYPLVTSFSLEVVYEELRQVAC